MWLHDHIQNLYIQKIFISQENANILQWLPIETDRCEENSTKNVKLLSTEIVHSLRFTRIAIDVTMRWRHLVFSEIRNHNSVNHE